MTLAQAFNHVDVPFTTNIHHFQYVDPYSRTHKTSLFQVEESETSVAEEMACSDLSGNTFWEFKDSLTAGRLRRIAEADPRTHYSDIKLSPQWHQWLRHTRADPPSIEEQQSDIQRQAQLKQLARLADERWAAKPSYLDAPKERSQPGPATLPRDPGGYVGQTEPDEKEGVRNLVAGIDDMEDSNKKTQDQYKGKENPWKARKGNPGEGWQPAAWTPGSTNRR